LKATLCFVLADDLQINILKLVAGYGTVVQPACLCIPSRTQGGVGVKKKPLSLIFYKNFITCAKDINCFRTLFACYFVDLMQTPPNKLAYKFQVTL